MHLLLDLRHAGSAVFLVHLLLHCKQKCLFVCLVCLGPVKQLNRIKGCKITSAYTQCTEQRGADTGQQSLSSCLDEWVSSLNLKCCRDVRVRGKTRTNQNLSFTRLSVHPCQVSTPTPPPPTPSWGVQPLRTCTRLFVHMQTPAEQKGGRGQEKEKQISLYVYELF